jgi:hypothetical protein
MSKNKAVSGQFDLDATPLTVSGASGMRDETLWRTRRPRCMSIRTPIRGSQIGDSWLSVDKSAISAPTPWIWRKTMGSGASASRRSALRNH